MTEINVNCPNCGEPLVVAEETHNFVILSGVRDECPKCGAALAYGDDGLVLASQEKEE